MARRPDFFEHEGGDEPTDPFWVRHWFGELPLVRSALQWLAAPWLAGSLAVGALATHASLGESGVRLASSRTALARPLLIALTAWGAVGTWRAATAWRRRGGHPAAAFAAWALAALTGGGTVLSAALHYLPRIPAMAQLTFGFDPDGQVQATLAPDGRRLQLQGHLGVGDAARVQALITSAPQARLLEIGSLAGRLAEARQLAGQLRGKGWHVRVAGTCENACTLLFMAGAVRQLAPEGRLAFHRLPVDSLNPLLARRARAAQTALYREAGFGEHLLKKAMATPPSARWMPELDELLAGGVLSTPARALDVALPPIDAPQQADFAAALATHPTWQALERRHAGTIADAAARMVAARRDGAGDAELQVAAQRGVEALLPRLLGDAGWELRDQYLVLLADQITAVRGEEGPCRGLLAGDAQLRRELPPELSRREAAWLADAAGEPAREQPPRPPTGPELEVVRRWLGPRAPVQLGELRRPGSDTRACAAARSLIAKVLDMPPAERRLAIRFMFEPPAAPRP